MQENLILRADSYKYSHFKQYPPGTTEVSAYIEARAGGRFENVTFFGLQAFLEEYLFYYQTDHFDVMQAKDIITEHGLPFNTDDWKAIVEDHDGHLPIEIQALPEGMTVPVGTPLVQVRNTDPRFPWLSTFIETQLLRAVWYPSTVATLSRHAKEIIYAGLLRSSEDPNGQIPFKLHDFGARGCTSSEQAELGGMAHLVNFMGSDTVEGLMAARRYYGAKMPAFSIPAAEHSTITSWGKDRESGAYLNMVEQFGGKDKIYAVVSDSYDLDNAVEKIWGETLKNNVLLKGGTLVVRPDSGDPVMTPVRVIEKLGEKFGYTFNKKGYKVLHPSVRVIQGDGMNLQTIRFLVEHVTMSGWSIDNIAFGMGGGLLQQVTRDDLRFAMKANEIVVDGVTRPVSKNPSTDPTKSSKAGRQAVIQVGSDILTQREDAGPVWKMDAKCNLLKPVWRNGKFLRKHTFDEVRARAAQGFSAAR